MADADGDILYGELQGTGLAHWLNCRSRCFGDKGDVEDITEGQWVPLALSPFELPLADIDVFDGADIISTVEFDHTGNYLATGDKGGRVVLFERNESVSSSATSCGYKGCPS